MAENGHIKDGFGSCTKTCIHIPRFLNLYARERSYKRPCLVPWLQYLAFLYGRGMHRLCFGLLTKIYMLCLAFLFDRERSYKDC